MAKKSKKKAKKFFIALLVIAAVAAIIIIPQKCSATVSSNMSIAALAKKKPLYVAHRGLSALYPQNTVPAFEAAKENGYYGYEFDIHTTSDGKWVVIHDDTVDAMTDGTGELESYTLEELMNMNIDAGNGIENYEQLKMPTLEETLNICNDSDIIPVIEIKKCDVKYLPDFIEMLKERELLDKAVIISFNFDYLKEVQKLNKEVKLMYLLNIVSKKDVDLCVQNGSIGIDFNDDCFVLSAGAIRYAKKQGLALGSWTVDNTISSDILRAAGIELITTNRIIP